MMTEKLFYQDPYINSFEATVVESGTEENGRHFVVLDKTAFYPTGGGQPYDQGTIDGIEVSDVEDVNGEVRHYLNAALNKKQITANIDWNRRFDHMQQHAGQHILSAAFADKLGLKTISFHLGTDDVTIDLDTNQLTEAQVREAEQIANEIVFQNKPIQTKWVTLEELNNYPIRKQPKVTEGIRLVIIDGYDYNACGGTHPKTTGEVGPIHILSWEKNQKGMRIHFLCGWRAFQAFTQKQEVIQSLNRTLSSNDHELQEKVDQLLEKQHQLEKQLKDAEEQLLKIEANELLENAQVFDHFRLVARSFICRDVPECQLLSRFILDQSEDIVTLFTTKNGARLHIIGARNSQVTDIDMRELVQKGLEIINGRGGGKPERAQGGAETDLTAEGMLAHLVDILEKEKVTP
jgi:alanyl-tRNA synthetase